jgi:hypothetical protein
VNLEIKRERKEKKKKRTDLLLGQLLSSRPTSTLQPAQPNCGSHYKTLTGRPSRQPPPPPPLLSICLSAPLTRGSRLSGPSPRCRCNRNADYLAGDLAPRASLGLRYRSINRASQSNRSPQPNAPSPAIADLGGVCRRQGSPLSGPIEVHLGTPGAHGTSGGWLLLDRAGGAVGVAEFRAGGARARDFFTKDRESTVLRGQLPPLPSSCGE